MYAAISEIEIAIYLLYFILVYFSLFFLILSDMDSGAVGWVPLIKSWASKVAQKSTQLASLLEKMLLDFLNDALAVVKLCNQPLYL